jgi:chemotaxis protein methyltransferase CheR
VTQMHLRVLIIHERESFCEFLSGLLTADGHTPVCALGFREAQRSAFMVSPDLIIIEISRPDIGALEIVQRLKRVEETRNIPIIVISDSPELEYEFLNVFDFMAKPVDLRRLREDIDVLVKGRAKRSNSVATESLTSDDHLLFHDYLMTHSGLHFERRNLKILERGVAARMSALRIGSCREYFDYLTGKRDNRQELQKLLPFLTVGETFFFRYHAHYEILRNILAMGRAAPQRKKIRLWSAGCSTGEEAYSMAITVMETLPDWRERDIRILATDIDNRALQKAREGVYGSWAMRVIEKSYLDRYFTRIGKSYLVNAEVKSLVDFSHLNLQTDEFPAPDGEFRDLDVVFCRNVMIYFSLATTRKIVEKIAATLAPGGCLFLGHAETLSQISSGFERHSSAGSFYYREKKDRGGSVRRDKPSLREPETELKPVKSPAPRMRPAPPVSPVSAVSPPGRMAAKPEPDLAELFTKAEILFEAEEFRKAADILADVLCKKPDHTGALVIQGFIMANNGRFQEALDYCNKALEIDDLLPEAYFLKGLLLDMNDSLAEAVEEYRKTILLRIDFIMSHYHLGRLFYRLGRETEGARELRNTLKILEKARQGSVVPFSGGLSREVFLQQVRGELAKVA